MPNFGWSLPPGCPGAHAEEVEFRCVNPACSEYGSVVEVPATWELGGTFLNNDDDSYCGTCGWEMADSDWTDYPIVEDDKHRPVLVSIRDDAVIRVEVSKDEDGGDALNIRRASRAALEAMKPILKQDAAIRAEDAQRKREAAQRGSA